MITLRRLGILETRTRLKTECTVLLVDRLKDRAKASREGHVGRHA